MVKKLLIIYVLFVGTTIYAQDNAAYENLIPKSIESPNIAALNKFIEHPVSHFNGTADVSFPLYQINLKNLTLPITLRYHTGGIRVNEEASWVGLGWALNAGGSISHQINGKDDEDNFSQFWGRYFPFSDQQQNESYHDNMNPILVTGPNLFNGQGEAEDVVEKFTHRTDYYDTEPDLYMYNMGNYSGKFISDNYNNSVVGGIDLSANGVIFKNYYNQMNDSIIATTPDGNIYKFKDRETTKDVDGGTQEIRNNSYLLSEILTPDGERIKFQYKSFKQIYDEKNWQNLYPGYGGNFSTDHFPNAPVLAEDFTEIDKQSGLYPNSIDGFTINKTRVNNFVKNLYLTKIEFPGGTIEFINSYRQDRYGVKLNKIVVKNNNGERVKEVAFNYEYFIGHTPDGQEATTIPYSTSINVDYPIDYLKKRLKLISFGEVNLKNNAEVIKHNFNYNETQLPYKSSFAQDFWGFYNGKPNRTLLPSYFLYKDSFNIPPSFEGEDGANRNVDTTKAVAGVLTEIIFPTGGKTKYEYGSNETINYSNCFNETEQERIMASDPGYETPSQQNQVIVNGISYNYFTIDESTLMDIQVSLFRDAHVETSSSSLYPSSYHFVRIEKKYNNDWVVYNNYNWDTVNSNAVSLNIADQNLSLGEYRLVANYPNNYPTSLGSNMASISTVKYEKTTKCSNYTGGLRIEEVNHKESDYSQYLTTTFKYRNGILATIPAFIYSYSYLFEEDRNGQKYPYVIKETHLSTNSVYPYSYSANGSLVGYRNITEMKSDGENGKTDYEYTMFNDGNIFGYTGMPGILPASNLKNGFLEAVYIYNAQDALQPIKVTKYTPYILNPKVRWAFKIGPGIFKYGNLSETTSQSEAKDKMETFFYPVIQGKVVPKMVHKSENGEFIGGVGSTITTTTDYTYSIPTLPFPTSVKESRSDGGENTKNILYSSQYNDIWDELTPAQRGGVQDLVNQNRILPIQESSYVDNEFISSVTTNYIDWDSTGEKFVAPESIVTKNSGQQSSEIRATFNSFDLKNGNILESQKKDGIPVSYIWGYNKTLLVAKIENAKYDAISSSIISAIQFASNSGTKQELLQEFSNLRNSLPNAMITSYTHDPLIGISSITDPGGQTLYYDYDGFNRLEYIKDAEEKVLSKNEYNYKN